MLSAVRTSPNAAPLPVSLSSRVELACATLESTALNPAQPLNPGAEAGYDWLNVDGGYSPGGVIKLHVSALREESDHARRRQRGECWIPTPNGGTSPRCIPALKWFRPAFGIETVCFCRVVG